MTRYRILPGAPPVRAVALAAAALLVAGVAAAASSPQTRPIQVETAAAPGLTAPLRPDALDAPVGEPDAIEAPAIIVPTTIPAPVPTTVPPLPEVVPAVPAVPAPVPPVLLPPTTAPPPRTRTTVPRPSQPGSRCGTPSGGGGLGADQTVQSESTRVTLTVYPCVTYDPPDYTQWNVTISDPGTVRSVHLDFGDGTSDHQDMNWWQCDPGRPNPSYANPGHHTHATPGAYTVTATVVTASCAEWEARHEFTDERTTVVTMTVYREAGGFPGH